MSIIFITSIFNIIVWCHLRLRLIFFFFVINTPHLNCVIGTKLKWYILNFELFYRYSWNQYSVDMQNQSILSAHKNNNSGKIALHIFCTCVVLLYSCSPVSMFKIWESEPYWWLFQVKDYLVIFSLPSTCRFTNQKLQRQLMQRTISNHQLQRLHLTRRRHFETSNGQKKRRINLIG